MCPCIFADIDALMHRCSCTFHRCSIAEAAGYLANKFQQGGRGKAPHIILDVLGIKDKTPCPGVAFFEGHACWDEDGTLFRVEGKERIACNSLSELLEGIRHRALIEKFIAAFTKPKDDAWQTSKIEDFPATVRAYFDKKRMKAHETEVSVW